MNSWSMRTRSTTTTASSSLMRSPERLDPKMAREARREEVSFMKRIELYDEVDLSECWTATGRGPVSTKWVDINKGSITEPDVRCRLVARDFKSKGDDLRSDLFAAMPSLEAKKMLFRMAAAQNYDDKNCAKLMFIDVKKAHLNGIVGEDELVFVELPVEAGAPGKCGRLRRWLYGMRPAAQAWERDYSERLENIRFVKGRSAPIVFYNQATSVRGVVHGDDFTFLGKKKDLDELAKTMKTWYELKVKAVLGPEIKDDKVATILNRKVTWSHDGIRVEADHKHAEVLAHELGLDKDSKGFDVPIVKETKEELMDDETVKPLNA